MQATIKCPRCQEENARAPQRCFACGEWLHGRSPIVGVCPACRLPVRATELACSNCGRYLEPSASEQAAASSAAEARPSAPARKVVVHYARGPVRMLSPALVANAIGIALLGVATARGLVALQDYRQAPIAGQAFYVSYPFGVWSVVGLVGLLMLIIGATLLRARR